MLQIEHGFGLVSGLLSWLWAGATVACGPEFQAVNFASLIGELQPTWYTAGKDRLADGGPQQGRD